MQFTSVVGAVAFSTVAYAQASIDIPLAEQVFSEGGALIASITANPDFVSDEAVLATAIPSSVLAAQLGNPVAVLEAVATDTVLPSFATAVPTEVLENLASVAAVPIELGEAVASYVEAAISDPRFPAASSALASALPSNDRSLFQSDPAAFIAGALKVSATPSYFSALPSALQSNLAGFINGGLAIEASILAAPAPTAAPSMNTSVVPATGTGATHSSTSSPIPFVGAASSINANTIGAAVMVTFGFVLALL